MKTIIECPFCRKAIEIIRKIPVGEEILEDVYCPHCKRSMSMEFDAFSNLPFLLAYYGFSGTPSPLKLLNYPNHMTGIRIKKSEEHVRKKSYEIRYHPDSIDASINIRYKDTHTEYFICAECGYTVFLNKKMKKKDVYGLFCNSCAIRLKFRFSYEFLSEFYDAEQSLLKQEIKEDEEESQQINHQEEKIMQIKSTIIGFVLEDNGIYKIYNPQTNQLANLEKKDFESLCLGEFPYRKIRANTLANNEVVETLDGKIYYVSNAANNELFDFSTGKIERSAIVTNLMVNTNCYVKYVPVLKKYCTFADVAAGTIDPRIAKMVEIIANDIQSCGGSETPSESNTIAKMVRFLVDPDYSDLLDTETLRDMVMADTQAFMVMSQMTNMQMAQTIMQNHGSIPLAVQTPPVDTVATVDNSLKLDTESDEEYKQRLSTLMEEAVKNANYAEAAKYQSVLKSLN